MIGKTLGHYRVGEQLGRGGMGEVYLADDLNLNRKVALKLLPDAFAGDPEIMARFEREAKLLASLNHPNIAAIHGLEEAEGKRFLVLELVEGETLAQKLSKGPFPVEEALGICRQIAEGLEAAHEKGVVHRDLKPANVMITEGDKVKILDFGLAKALSDEAQSVDSSQSPTLTEAMTRPGVILGTAAYMSPEQAKGKSVDKRADIWAFGCILYECLTGEKAFEGETVTETLAAVLRGEPDWQALSATTPPNICFVLHRCLEKEMSRRLRDAADVRMLSEEAPGIGEAAAPARQWWLWIAWSVAGLAILFAIALAFVHFDKKPSVADPMRFKIDLPEKVSPGSTGGFALSPDGRRLAFVGIGSDGVTRVWMRTLESLDARPLFGTEASYMPPLFWSPDSRFVVFYTDGKLKKIDVSGGPPQTLSDYPGLAVGGSWNRDGVIIYGTGSEGLMRVSAGGGVTSPLTKLAPSRQETAHRYPSFLPDGKHFLYLSISSVSEKSGVYLGSLDSKPEQQGSRQLLATNFGPVYVPSQDSGPGYILFLRDRTLMAQSFDERGMELVGEPLVLAEQVGSRSAFGFFSASTNGVLAYRSGGSILSLLQPTWFDRQGKALGTVGEFGTYFGIALSPDGKQAILGSANVLQVTISMDLWLLDLSRGTNTRFTFGKGRNAMAIWSSDGNRIIFASDRDGGVYNLYQKLTSGVEDETLIFKSSESKLPTSWSSDGRFLLYDMQDPKTSNNDVFIIPLEGDRKPVPFLHTEFNEMDGHFSPDMRWVAYVSDESGGDEIYVRAFSPVSGGSQLKAGGKCLVSKGGGRTPRWRADGKELYYRAIDGKVMAVGVIPGTSFEAEIPKPLFPVPPPPTLSFGVSLYSVYQYAFSAWDVAADGNRFLLPVPSVESSPSPFTVVLSWTSLLKK